MGLAVNMNCWV